MRGQTIESADEQRSEDPSSTEAFTVKGGERRERERQKDRQRQGDKRGTEMLHFVILLVLILFPNLGSELFRETVLKVYRLSHYGLNNNNKQCLCRSIFPELKQRQQEDHESKAK